MINRIGNYTLISPELVDELEQKRDYLCKNNNYNLRRRKMLVQAHNANELHSWWLEHPPKVRERLGAEGENIRRTAAQGVKHIKLAKKHLSQTHNLRESLSHKLLQEIGHLVDPRNSGYRTDKKTLNLGFVYGENNFTPPNPVRVEDRLNTFFADMQDSGFHDIEAAIYAHLIIAGIQPFDHGNKRTARIFQTQLLHEAGYPPGPIPLGERSTYIKLIDQALCGSFLCEDDSTYIGELAPFFQYQAGKINRTFDKIIDDLGLYDGNL